MPEPALRCAPKRLRLDPQLYAELAYCVPLGIPHSVLLGRVVGPDDPRWLTDDVDKVLAYRHEEALKCSRCRTREDEWLPKLGGDLHAYYGEPFRCFGCEALDMALRDAPEGELGVHVRLARPEPDDDGV